MNRLTLTFDPRNVEMELNEETIKNFRKEFPFILAIEVYPPSEAKMVLQIPDDMDINELFFLFKKNGFYVRDMSK